MKFLNLAIVSIVGFLLQGCADLSTVYIPPASPQMPKAQMVYVSASSWSLNELLGSDWAVVNIDGISIVDFLGNRENFYVMPGKHQIDYIVEYAGGSYDQRKAVNTKIVVSPTQAGTTMSEYDFIHQ